MEDFEDDDDWLDVEAPQKRNKSDFEASVRTTGIKRGSKISYLSYISLKGPNIDWINKHGNRYKIQVGGGSNKIRIAPHPEGRFEPYTPRGQTIRFNLTVPDWPDENREPTEAIVTIRDNPDPCMILTLPISWLRPEKAPERNRESESTPIKVPERPIAPKPNSEPIAPQPLKISPGARQLAEAAVAIKKK